MQENALFENEFFILFWNGRWDNMVNKMLKSNY